VTRPFVLFDLGETLVDLGELLACLARRISEGFPPLRAESGMLVRRWIMEAARAMPRGDDDVFVTEFRVASTTLGRLLREKGIAIEDEDAGLVLREAWDAFELRVHFCNGVSENWLAEVHRLTSGMAVVTDGDRENVSRLFQRLPLGKYFSVVVTSEDARAYKPNPKIYEAALGALHAPPQESLFVSDLPLDLRGAAALGMATALMGRPLDHRPSDLPTNAFLLSSPQELNGILDRFATVGRFEFPRED